MLYCTTYWAVRKHHIDKMSVAKMTMLKWIYNNIRNDGIKNEVIRKIWRQQQLRTN